ncbi:hypothetical protein KBY83_12095 [Cyanobium sp. WKJ7-Wakatipu]|uniref:hypothetical protein n=1 Tax=Cyanobium sp. WKJ7-Wakatipu TaxID=2823726 RepID=UPI0020CC3933|nr:hypothetical protein [Cyanobium sp. WKJ7-Wakatipu]MCP9784045.1 hypothetical protein [Cyanobium sp. WKJ7-Wakatipu]
MQGPGFLEDGQYVGPAGLLIPARNDAGQIVGYQVAPDRPGDGGKYKWISGPIHKIGLGEEGEWPVFQGGTDKASSEVWAVDGALKAALTSAQYGVPTVGVPGARFTTSGQQLLRVLGRIMPSTQDERLVLLMPDAGDVVNLADMPTNLLATAAFLRAHGFTVRFGWWGQIHKETGLDIDERLIVRAEDGGQVERITPDQFYNLVTDTTGKAPRRTFANPKMGVHWVSGAEALPTLEITPPDREGYQFAQGKRLEVLQSLQKQGVRFVLDRSAPGSGKSWDITHADPKAFGGAQIVMVARRALDVGREFGVAVLRGKDQGRTFNGSDRLVRATDETPDDELVMEANCAMGSDVEYLFSKGMFMNVSSICDLCEAKHECNATAGWYKYDKKAVLKESAYVTEPEGLDFTTFCDAKGKAWVNPEKQQPGVVLMIDESAAMPWVQTTIVSLDDLVEHCMEFGQPENRLRINTSFLKVLDALAVAMLAANREVSIPHYKVMALIDSKLRQGEVDVADAMEITLLEETLLSSKTTMVGAWCTPLLEAMFGRGRIWIEGEQLFLMRPNDRFIEALHHPAVRQVVFFDGTGAVTELEGWLGEHIEVIEERAPAEQAEICITQYVGLGRMGFTRKPVQEKQANILLDELKATGAITKNTPVVDIKRTKVAKARKPLTWLSTSRGSNSAAKAKDLVIIGAPGTNLVSALNRYCLLYGVDIELEDTGTFHRRFWSQSASRNEGGGLFIESSWESTHYGFRNYYRKLIEAELDQAIHRLRGVRRPGEVLNVHWISDFCHPRWEVEIVRADEVVDLFSPVGLEVGTVQAVIKRLARGGNPRPTHHQVATELGVRSADVARWIDSDPWLEAEFGWLDRTRRNSPAYNAVKVAPVTNPVPPREPIPDEQLVRMQELLPLGTRVTNTYDRRKAGVVVDYLMERGIPKFVVELEDGTRNAFPKSLLTFAAQLV